MSRPFRVNEVVKRAKLSELEQVEGPGAPARFYLNGTNLVVGRSRDADITIGSQMMSRKHVALKKSGPEFQAVDLDSKYGMYLNGLKAHSVVLRDGDVLQLGDVMLVYHEGD